MTALRFLRSAGPALLMLIASASCDEPFQPFGEQTLIFSVYGYLDASADTQWVRVMPIRQSVLTSEEPLDAIVTLEKVGDGEVVLLRDSVFAFARVGVELGAPTFVHNFWTTEDVEPGATYRLTVTRSDGASSMSTVPIPTELPSVYVRMDGDSQTVGYVSFEEVENVVMVHVLHYMLQPCAGPPVVAVAQPLLGSDLELGRVSISRTVADLFPCPVERQEIRIVRSGSIWPSGIEFPSLLLLPPNVENAVGFLGGVVTTTVPWEHCTWLPARSLPCFMTYDSRSVTVAGTVTDGTCGGPISRMSAPADIRLTELNWGWDGEALETGQSRITSTDGNGAYRVSGLHSFKYYALSVSHPAGWPPDRPVMPVYVEHEDTLWFSPGEHVTLDVALQRQIGVCDNL